MWIAYFIAIRIVHTKSVVTFADSGGFMPTVHRGRLLWCSTSVWLSIAVRDTRQLRAPPGIRRLLDKCKSMFQKTLISMLNLLRKFLLSGEPRPLYYVEVTFLPYDNFASPLNEVFAAARSGAGFLGKECSRILILCRSETWREADPPECRSSTGTNDASVTGQNALKLARNVVVTGPAAHRPACLSQTERRTENDSKWEDGGAIRR